MSPLDRACLLLGRAVIDMDAMQEEMSALTFERDELRHRLEETATEPDPT